MEEPYRWDAEAIQQLVGEVEDIGVEQLWMVCHVDETIHFLSEKAPKISTLPLPSNLLDIILNISYSALHERFAEASFEDFEFPVPKDQGVPVFYLIFNRVAPDEGRVSIPPMRTGLPPPIRPRLLNTLLASMVSNTKININLVDVDSWPHGWLSRNFYYRGVNIVEETASSANLQERLLWWFETMIKIRYHSKPNKGKRCRRKAKFIASYELRKRVSSQEVYERIMKP
jgi:hypothetical protein